MRNGFWNTISRMVITTSMVIGVQSAANSMGLYGQDVVQDQSDKKTTEPVFRISKLVGVSGDSANTNNNGRQLVEQQREQSVLQQQPVIQQVKNSVGQSNQPNARLANAKGLPAGSMIPGAGVSSPRSLPPVANLAPKSATPRTGAVSDSTGNSAASSVAGPVAKPGPPPHPLDRAVAKAYEALEGMKTSVFDYTAIMSKREQVNGRIGSPSYMQVKFRCPRQLANGTKVPFSIYMKFLKPRDSAGREVIWVAGQNSNNIAAHEAKGTLLGRRTFNLNPTGFLAMKGQRYPIYEAGVENLIIKLIEKAERDRAAGPCEVVYRENGNINNRPCSVIELVHNDRRAPYEFHKAQVFIDKELNIPVRYAAFDWPVTQGGEPPLIEEYTYFNIKVNVGLTDDDFDPRNKAYSFPR